MSKHSLIIITAIMSLLLPGCSKNNETLALIGDESDMMSYYQIYPQQYFPISEINQETLNGRFPPDITGEYEMTANFVDGYYEYYYGGTYMPYPYYPPQKMMNIIIEDQVNGMAKIKFSLEGEQFETEAYIYGNVFSDNNTDFVMFFENSQGTDVVKYYRGNIVKGSICSEGIRNIHTWTVIKDREFDNLINFILNVGGYEHRYNDFAERKNN